MARTRTRIEDPKTQPNAAAVAERRARTQLAADEAASNGQSAVRKERAAPAARRGRRGLSLGIGGLLDRIPVVRNVAGYFRGVISEMQKVTWPSREETSRLTSVVLAVTIAFSIGLGLLDTFYSWWFRQAFHANTEWVFLAVGAAVAVLVSGGYFALRHRI
ncbi:MAG: preprotein translocase subunit SecE [Anaerolineae bacterium]|nr:preprotein translocase subunit SecE [Anaerolineae bacterium]MEB2289258.1 preprotein translocase subunit SecE [Anaerolineae bacterium]